MDQQPEFRAVIRCKHGSPQLATLVRVDAPWAPACAYVVAIPEDECPEAKAVARPPSAFRMWREARRMRRALRRSHPLEGW